MVSSAGGRRGGAEASELKELLKDLPDEQKAQAVPEQMETPEEPEEAQVPIELSAAEERQMRARPGVSRSVIVRRSVGPVRSVSGAPSPAMVGSPGVPRPAAFKSMAMPMSQTQTLPPRSTGKVTLIGTTTTYGNYSFFTPAQAGVDPGAIPPQSPAPGPPAAVTPGTVSLPMPSATAATMPALASVKLPTAAGMIQGQVGVQVGNVRRIR